MLQQCIPKLCSTFLRQAGKKMNFSCDRFGNLNKDFLIDIGPHRQSVRTIRLKEKAKAFTAFTLHARHGDKK